MTKAAKAQAVYAVNEGDKAPDFSVAGDGGRTLSLKDYAGKTIVLYFYPKDDTPGCTVEAKDFAANITAFEKLGAVIIGVSKDSVKSHDKFKQKYCLPFPLASDEDGSICENYGVWVEKSMYGKTYMGIDRATFIIDGKGIVRNVWRKVKVDGHVAAVLDAVNAL